MDLSPTHRSPAPARISGYDLARALAVFGMVLVNFKVVMCMGDPALHATWLGRAVGMLDGRAAATFVVLAGVGISLGSARQLAGADAAGRKLARIRLWKRAAFLFVVGLLYIPIWPADILHFYGVYIAVAALLLNVASRRLVGLALALVSAHALLLLTLDYERGWNFETLSYVDFWEPAGMLRHLLFNGFHPVIPWLAFLLFGMVLGRLNMRERSTRARVFLAGAGAAIVAQATSWMLIGSLGDALSGQELEDLSAVFGTDPMPPMPLYMFAAGGTACASIALCVELGERFGTALWLRSLVSVGQLALTLYVAHVVLGMGLLGAAGRLEHQSLPFAVGMAFVFCAVATLFAILWRKRFARGPLEECMRRVCS